MFNLLAVALAISAHLPAFALGARIYGRELNETLLESYDYIVVGCGISGLVVTNRLSEDPSVTVLCIEAGIPDHYEAVIQDPVYVGGDIGGVYDWKLSTTPQTQLDGATRPIPQGKVLGGGSILNAMCWNRGGADDYDAWEALGNPGWGWKGLLPYFIKSETYTPVYSEEIAREYSINYDPAVHGTSGPVQVSYPKYFYPQSINLFQGLNYLGVPTEFDPNDGTTAGAAFVPTDLDPNNQTRSDARRTYYDPYVHRSNFHVITGQHVTRVLIEGIDGNAKVSNPTAGGNENGDGSASGNPDGFGFGPSANTPPNPVQTNPVQTNDRFVRRGDPRSSKLRIIGVEFAPDASTQRQTVYATREVIVAAGSLHSAQLLQLSGIGSSSLLAAYNITVALDLPGVGNNLQDHCLVGTFYPYNNNSYPSPTELTTNATYNAEAEAEYNSNKTGPWTAGSPNALAFPPLPLISNNSAAILSNASSQSPSEYLVSGLDATVVTGFTAQKQSLVERLGRRNVAAYEIINNNAGSLTLAVMHPFSRGTCRINSADPFEPPQIDPRWLSNPADRQVLVEAMLFNRRILDTPSMRLLQAAQFVPPIEADIDAINQVINNGIRTEFHPSGTCAMLPLDHGGVVDPHLRVYGTRNLRVVDAGIFPMIPGAHLQAVVYGVAEKAADIIKEDNVRPSAIPTSSRASSTSVITTAVPTSNSTSALPSSLLATGPMSSSIVSSTSSTITTLNSSSAASASATSASPPYFHTSLEVPTYPGTLISDKSSTSVTMSSKEDTTVDNTATASKSLAKSSPSPFHSAGEASSISAVLSTPDLPSASKSKSEVEATTISSPTPSLLDPAKLSSSVVAALTSKGVPSAVITAVVPVILGTATTGSVVPSASASAAESQEQRQAAIDAFIQWLLHFLGLS